MKYRFILMGLVVFLIGIFLIFIFTNKKETANLDMPDLNKIVSISLEKNSKVKMISSEEDIKNIYDIIDSDFKVSTFKNKNSIEELTKVSFNYEENVAMVILIYKSKNKYYIEDVNNKVYEIDIKDYQKIENYL